MASGYSLDAMQVAEAPTTTSQHPNALLNTNEAAAFLGLKPRTLVKWRVAGYGPIFFKVGSRVRYRVRDLDAWLDTRKATSTSES